MSGGATAEELAAVLAAALRLRSAPARAGAATGAGTAAGDGGVPPGLAAWLRQRQAVLGRTPRPWPGLRHR